VFAATAIETVAELCTRWSATSTNSPLGYEKVLGITCSSNDVTNIKEIYFKTVKYTRTPLQITRDNKPLENVEQVNYLGSMITNDEKCTREIKARIAMAKAAFNKKTLFASKLDLELRKKLVKCYI
jgi:hypothetical protein